MRNAMMIFGVAVMGMGLLAATTAQAAVIFEHSGSIDPLTEGFTASFSPNGSADTGPPANWKMVHASGAYGYYNYAVTAADLADPSGWTYTQTFKLNAAFDKYLATMRVKDSISRVNLTFVDGTGPMDKGAYYEHGVGAWTKLGDVDPTDGFHTYQAVFDPKDAGTEDDELSFYVDGDLITTALRSGLNDLGGDPQFFFGKATALGSADQQYSLVRLETGQHPIEVVTYPIGDATKDGVVDEADAARLAENWLAAGGWDEGNFNDDEIVDDKDAALMAANWGAGLAGASVPEPGSLILLIGLIGLAGLGRFRR